MSIRNGRVAYKSPIETIWSDIENEYGERFDQMVLTAVQCVGVRVNKEELVKALAYDRDQYRKGWEDRDSEIVRCFECKAFTLKAEKPRYTCYKVNGLNDPKPNDYCSYGERREDGVDR